MHNIFIDGSVDTGDISDDLTDEEIRVKIRDEYLKETSVTILLVGEETWGRKHIDWELHSSMFDGKINKKSGILVISLPSTGHVSATASHDNEKQIIHPGVNNWINLDTRSACDQIYPLMPDRVADNLLKKEAKISVIPWNRIAENPEILRFLIEATYNDRTVCEYDLSRPLRRKNHSDI